MFGATTDIILLRQHVAHGVDAEINACRFPKMGDEALDCPTGEAIAQRGRVGFKHFADFGTIRFGG